MSENFWKRLSAIAGLFALAAVFGLAYFSAHLEIKDLDLWLHIGTGRYIVTHGFQIPSVDVFSCTIPGKFWNNHEWLFQVLVYEIHKFFGFDGIINMQVVLVMLTMGILFIVGYNSEKQLSSIFVLLLTLLVYQGRFTTRPDLFSLLFFAGYIWVMSHFLGRRWSLYVLFFIQVLWTNMHGFFFFGPLFVSLGIFAEWLKRHAKLPWEWNRVGRLDDDEYRRLKWILFFVIVACFFNPQTFRGAWYPISVFFQLSGESKIFFDNIIELKRPITGATLWNWEEYPHYRLLIVLSAVSFFYNRRKIDVGALFFWLVFLFFSLAAIRNLAFFAFAAYFVFVTNALTVSWRDLVPLRIKDKRFIHIVLILVKIFLCCWIIQIGMSLSYHGYYDMDTYERKSEFGGVGLRSFPHKAVDFLVQNKIKGNFFNDFNSGAYLVGRCSPGIKVFIDGRTEVYGPQFFSRYKKAWGEADGLAPALDKFKITGAFLHSAKSTIPTATLKFFHNSKEWVPVYFDYDAVIYLKDVPRNQEIIKKFRIDWSGWKPKKIDIKKIGSKNVPIFPSINRVYTLSDLGLPDLALMELEEARKVNPANSEIYKHLGKIYAQKKDYEKAFENFRIAVVLSPNDEQARQNLALAYADLGELEYAAEQYVKITEIWPDKPKAYFLLAKILVRQKEYDQALAVLRQAFSMDPKAVKEVLDLGDMVKADKEYGAAREFYSLAAGGAVRQDQVHKKIGEIFMLLGDPAGARSEFEKSMNINSNQEDVRSQLHKLNSAASKRKPAKRT